ncbi:DnaJ-domain-containing protein [Pluteus cervinus]|uniref:DnaJ-domain-containing protein n=1 Tax=Pluteus cervinus TaxID=181527 RepID=A0ACD3BD69_9AGAR|nr:DnaJ-domain-containing protein [Pluteus cervinus]
MSSSTSSSLYHTLGVRTTATRDEIKKAYRIKALETHPDKLDPGVSERAKDRARARFQRVHEAFQILNDPEKRQAYDKEHLRSSTSRRPEKPLDRNVTTCEEDSGKVESKQERPRVDHPPRPRIAPTTRQPRPQSQVPTASELHSIPVSTSDRTTAPSARGREPQVQELPMVPQLINEAEKYEEFVDSILKAVVAANPEWEERKRKVMQLKMERESRNNTPQQALRSQ